MSVRVFRDADASLAHIEGEPVSIIGYGSQGRAQALNLRDSGVDLIIGNREDDFAAAARDDGFEVLSMADAATRARIVLFLVPDEIQAQVFEQAIHPGLEPGNMIVFAHGFALRYGLIDAPEDIDVALLAPRMPGAYLRQRYIAGKGVPAYVDVASDVTGLAWQRLLALAKGIGATRAGTLAVSFRDETELDLFSEHFTFPLIFRALEIAFEELVAAGYPPEVAIMELHGSGELGEVLEEAGRVGLYEMLERRASPAGRYGVLRHREAALDEQTTRQRARKALERIRNGSFARELVSDGGAGYPELGRLTELARHLPLSRAELAFNSLFHLDDGSGW